VRQKFWNAMHVKNEFKLIQNSSSFRDRKQAAEQARRGMIHQTAHLSVQYRNTVKEEEWIGDISQHNRAAQAVFKTAAEDPAQAGKLRVLVIGLNSTRPFFRSPVVMRKHMKRGCVGDAEEIVRRPFMLDQSIFGTRCFRADSKHYFDGAAVYAKKLKLHMAHCVSKRGFKYVVSKTIEGKDEGLPGQITSALVALTPVYSMLMHLYEAYCCDQPLTDQRTFYMRSGCWMTLCKDFSLIGKEDASVVFKASNFEENMRPELKAMKDENAMMQCEFLEALVRTSLLMFFQKGDDTFQLSEAVQRLVHGTLMPKMPPELLCGGIYVRKSFFRRRMYTEAVADEFEQKDGVLRAVYQHYKQHVRNREAGRNPLMDMESWVRLCDDTSLGLSTSQAKRCFMFSQMCRVDEVKSKMWVQCICFVEFLEAIARTADLLFPMAPEEEHAVVACMAGQDNELLNHAAHTVDWENIQTAELHEEAVPLHAKVNATLNMMLQALQEMSDVSTEGELVDSLRAQMVEANALTWDDEIIMKKLIAD